MRKIGVDELKKIELEILDEVDSICREEGILYSLAGGSLLGAIRHKGFIPWDDDVDLLLRRKDYDKLLNIISNKANGGIYVVSNNTSDVYNNLFAKICKTDTKYTEGTDANERGLGISIDVFPVDELGDDYHESIKILNTTLFQRELLIASNWRKYTRSRTHGLKYEPIRLMLFIFSRFINPHKLSLLIDSKICKLSKKNAKYSGVICGAYRNKEMMKSNVFSNYIYTEFEGKQYMIISDYDTYLHSLYGDYMKLPPKEKQVSHHVFCAYILSEEG